MNCSNFMIINFAQNVHVYTTESKVDRCQDLIISYSVVSSAINYGQHYHVF